MIDHDPTYTPPEKSLQNFLDLRFVQLLLAGLYYMLGRPVSGAQKAAYREQAYRVRAAKAAVQRSTKTRANNKAIIRRWSRDATPYWRECWRRLWQWLPARFTRFLPWRVIPNVISFRGLVFVSNDHRVKAPP